MVIVVAVITLIVVLNPTPFAFLGGVMVYVGLILAGLFGGRRRP